MEDSQEGQDPVPHSSDCCCCVRGLLRYALLLILFVLNPQIGLHLLGGLYFNTGITIAGFQSRVGCLFFLVSSSEDLRLHL